MTIGEARLRLSKLVPGVDPELLDGWLQERYREILDEMPWVRQMKLADLVLVAEYATGTVAATNGSTAITGTGTTWTSAMTGRQIRIAGDEAWYLFTYVSATAGTLDRAYEGATSTEATYRINKTVFDLPSDQRYIQSITSADGPLRKIDFDELQVFAAARELYGPPAYWTYRPQSGTTQQIELFPAPEDVERLVVHYTADPAELDVESTSTELPAWLNTGCLLVGAHADAKRHLEKYAEGDRLEARFQALLGQMRRVETMRIPPKLLKTHQPLEDRDRGGVRL